MDDLDKPVLSVADSFPSTEADAHARISDRTPSLSDKVLKELSRTSLLSTGNVDLVYRVNKLLDIKITDDFTKLATYIDKAVPDFFTRIMTKSTRVKDASNIVQSSEAAADSSSTASAEKTKFVHATFIGQPLSSIPLRSVLQDQTIHTHRAFLDEFKQLYDTFLDAAEHVQALDKMCTNLEEIYSPHAEQIEALIQHISTLEAELQLIDQRDHTLQEFRERLNFGPDEQRVLEEEPVGTVFMEALQRTRCVHTRSLSFSSFPEHQESASAVAEATYRAILKACEKITRYLLYSASSELFSEPSGKVHRTTIDADTPQVSKFYMQCLRVLHDESISHWEQVMREIAHQRRTSVLRRYFHLLTTGCATTRSSGAYHRPDSSASIVEDSERRGAVRPLEAELDNPVLFFSSLFAWLHQSIVEEDDFLGLFYGPTERKEAQPTSGERLSEGTPAIEVANSSLALTKQALLRSIFEGVAKQVHTSLETVLERIVHRWRALGSGKDRDADAAVSKMANSSNSQMVGSSDSHLGPRGLTGRLTKLFLIATGHSLTKPGDTPTSMGGKGENKANPSGALLSEMASSASSDMDKDFMRGSFAALQTCFQLLQLFDYYNTTTFELLLGPEASLTKFLSSTAEEDLQQVVNRLTTVVSKHLFDSVARVSSHMLILSRLASIHAASENSDGILNPAASTGIGPSAHPAVKMRVFVLDFLMKFTLEKHVQGYGEPCIESTMLSQSTMSSVAGRNSALTSGRKTPYHSAPAQELERLLRQQLLAVPPDVKECLQLLDMLMADTKRQQELVAAVLEQRVARDEQKEHLTGVNEKPEGCVDVKKDGRNPHQLSKYHFVVLIQTLLELDELMNQQSMIQHSLDDVCRSILQWNCYSALCDVLRKHEVIVASIPALRVSASSLQAVPNRKEPGPVACPIETPPLATGPVEEKSHNITLLLAVERKLENLGGVLKELFATVAVKFFFTGTNPVFDSSLSNLSSSSNFEECVKMAATNLKTMTDARAILATLYDFYNLVASNGGPLRLPMLAAIADRSERERLQQHIVAQILHAYDFLYVILERNVCSDFQDGSSPSTVLRWSPDEASTFSDMAPAKLRVLMEL